MPASILRGRINYYRGTTENGREWFEMADHVGAGEGSRTLRAYCEMDDIALTRDVSYYLDGQSRLVDAFCRVTKQGKVEGSTLFLSENGQVNCEGRIGAQGRISQSLPWNGPSGYLGLHPLVGDALVCLSRGTERPGEFITVPCLTNSVSPNGDEGLFAMPTQIDVAYLGEETVTVPAGEFMARRYALRWHPDWTPADVWVHGEQALFLRMAWDMLDVRYELVELTSGR